LAGKKAKQNPPSFLGDPPLLFPLGVYFILKKPSAPPPFFLVFWGGGGDFIQIRPVNEKKTVGGGFSPQSISLLGETIKTQKKKKIWGFFFWAPPPPPPPPPLPRGPPGLFWGAKLQKNLKIPDPEGRAPHTPGGTKGKKKIQTAPFIFFRKNYFEKQNPLVFWGGGRPPGNTKFCSPNHGGPPPYWRTEK